jgi:hypothetical protein
MVKLRRMSLAMPLTEIYSEPVTLTFYMNELFLAQRLMVAGDVRIAEIRVDGLHRTPQMLPEEMPDGFGDSIVDSNTTLYELEPPLELKPGEELQVIVWPLHPTKPPPQFARDASEWMRWQCMRFVPVVGWRLSRWIGSTRFARRTVAVGLNGIRKESAS